MVGFALEMLLTAICIAVVILISAFVIFVIKWMIGFISK